MERLNVLMLATMGFNRSVSKLKHQISLEKPTEAVEGFKMLLEAVGNRKLWLGRHWFQKGNLGLGIGEEELDEVMRISGIRYRQTIKERSTKVSS
jgi:hypothetical protein